MKNTILTIIMFLTPFLIFSQSRFEYVEGEVSIKRASGELFEAQIDDMINYGDSIITGFDGFAELSLESSSKITIDSDTVFILSKKENKGEKKSIFMVVLGKIGFKFDRLLNEPDIQTPATVAGIRGTEFTVVSALDGSAMYIVDEGSVAVESEGTLVVLNMEEGVEVPIGNEPGDKFEVKRGSVDFSGWLDEGNKQFENDPAGVLAGVTEKLIEYADESKVYYNSYETLYTSLVEKREILPKLEKEKGTETMQEFFKDEIRPLENLTTGSALNYRYYGLSALSLRRYVLSSMYIDMKTKYILDNTNSIYIDFIKEYEQFLKIYEETVVSYLVEADI